MPRYKVVRDDHNGSGEETLYVSDSLRDVGQYCIEKAGGLGGFDIGIDGGDLL